MRKLRARDNTRGNNRVGWRQSRFYWYGAYAWLGPLVVSGVTLVAEVAPTDVGPPQWLRPGIGGRPDCGGYNSCPPTTCFLDDKWAKVSLFFSIKDKNGFFPPIQVQSETTINDSSISEYKNWQ